VQVSSSAAFNRQLLFRLLDPLLLLAMLALAWWVRERRWPSAEIYPVLFAGLVFTLVIFQAAGVYRALSGPRIAEWCSKPLLALTLVLAGLLGAAYALKSSSDISRLVVGLWYACSVVSLVGSRLVAHRLILSHYRRGEWIESVVLVGEPRHALSFSRHLKQHPELGLKSVAIVSDRIGEIAGGTQTTILNGNLDDLPTLVDRHQARRVIVCGELGDQQVIIQALKLLAGRAVIIQYAPDYSTVPIFIFRTDDCAGRPLVDLSNSPWTDAARTLKWLEDKILASLILVLISPLLVCVAIAVRIGSPGPAIFTQDRHGLSGKPFRIYKFRTMRNDVPPDPPPAPALYNNEDSDDEDSEELGAYVPNPQSFVQAQAGDARVTAVGRFLRNTSMDELPQFWNVIKGDMSIVGPRPHAVAHNQQYVESIADLMRRHHVKPGITGLAQISGARGHTKNTQAMRDRIRYDLEYIQTWSLWLDLKIIFLTIFRGFFNSQP